MDQSIDPLRLAGARRLVVAMVGCATIAAIAGTVGFGLIWPPLALLWIAALALVAIGVLWKLR